MNKPHRAEPSFLRFWGKARPPEDRPSPSWHPVVYHLLDVAAVMAAVLEVRPVASARAARLLGISEEEARRLLVTLAALHDLGKFTPAFQAQVPELWDALSAAIGAVPVFPGRHTEDGLVLWMEALADSLGERIWPGAERALECLAPAIFGHHGRPVLAKDGRLRQGFRPGGNPAPLHAASECAAVLIELLCPEPIRARPPGARSARIASWYVAGLMTIADWIGSRVQWFPYCEPLPEDRTLERYWRRAREAAAHAVREAGIVAPPPAPLRPFHELTQLDASPTPLQQWAAAVDLPDSPCLVIVEDVTGAGKTEAAQMIVHRLLAAGRAAGAFWAMPTQATADAMYERQAKMLERLFADGADPKPSLVLAHGQQKLNARFRGTVLYGPPNLPHGRGSEGTRPEDVDDELAGSVACAAFLAEDRRAALLADVGAGTIDQALLGVLPSRFNAVRLLGLADKVLVVDEAHAYDAYMGTELEELLRFQAAFGGYAVVLSATLAQAQRYKLAAAWADGLRLGGWAGVPRSGEDEPRRAEYPLATIVSAAGVREHPLETASWSSRDIGVRWMHELDTAVEHAAAMAGAGAAVAWVRNTVDDCLAAAAALRARGVERVLVFHARFAQCDRQAREREVLAKFGKSASAEDRKGWVLVATQVVEQSLDLDFDVMISDLAPVDLLIQRAGRLWRHVWRDELRRQRGIGRELVVLAPQRDRDPPEGWLGGAFRGTAAVYRNHGVLWRTVEALAEAGRITTPQGLRALVEAVYGSEAVPDALVRSTQRAEAEALSAASTAQYGTLKVGHGYAAADQPWQDDLRVPTRLGDDYVTVRLARVRSDQALVPWADVKPSWRAWALSEVRVRANRIPRQAVPLPQYRDAAAAVRSDWGPFEQGIPLLPLLETSAGQYTGALTVDSRKDPLRLEYSATEGLRFGGAAADREFAVPPDVGPRS